jgi:hypothetical protein
MTIYVLVFAYAMFLAHFDLAYLISGLQSYRFTVHLMVHLFISVLLIYILRFSSYFPPLLNPRPQIKHKELSAPLLLYYLLANLFCFSRS